MKSSQLFKTASLFIAFMILAVSSASGSNQLPDTTRNNGVRFIGLTKTLTSLLKTRTTQPVLLGEYEIDIEKLIDDDLAGVFDCDSVVIQTLSDSEDCVTYDLLSWEMSRAIESRFTADDGSLYVDVHTDTTVNGLFFNITIDMSIPVSVPVVFNASDSGFSTSFDTTCTLGFNADIDLFVDAELALKDSASRATSIRINTFTVELYSVPWQEFEYYECFDCDWESIDFSALNEESGQLIPFTINNIPFRAKQLCFILYAKSYWYLSPLEPDNSLVDEGDFSVLTFEQIEKGEFIWEESHLSALEAVMVMLPATESWDSLSISDNRAMFQYTVDDLFDGESLEQIWLHSDFYTDEGATLRTRKYKLDR